MLPAVADGSHRIHRVPAKAGVQAGLPPSRANILVHQDTAADADDIATSSVPAGLRNRGGEGGLHIRERHRLQRDQALPLTRHVGQHAADPARRQRPQNGHDERARPVRLLEQGERDDDDRSGIRPEAEHRLAAARPFIRVEAGGAGHAGDV